MVLSVNLTEDHSSTVGPRWSSVIVHGLFCQPGVPVASVDCVKLYYIPTSRNPAMKVNLVYKQLLIPNLTTAGPLNDPWDNHFGLFKFQQYTAQPKYTHMYPKTVLQHTTIHVETQ